MGGFYLPAPSLRQLTCVLMDAGLILSTFLFAVAIRLGNPSHALAAQAGLYPKLIVLAVVFQLCIYYNDLYEERSPRGNTDLFLRVGRSLLAAGVLLSILYYALPGLMLGRAIMLMHFSLALVALLMWRSFYYWVLQRDALIQNIVILGTGPAAQEIAREILHRSHRGYRILGFLGEDASKVGQRLVNPSVIGTMADLPHFIELLQVNSVVVALEDLRGKLPVDSLLRFRLEGVFIEDAASFYEKLTGRILVRSLRPSWLIFSRGFNKPRLLRNSKRAAEFFVAFVILVFTFPLLLVAAIAIWLEGRGPILYRQERVGEKSRRFILYKLRTMQHDAEKATGPVWASSEDPRVTRVGWFLRKSRIDELTQLVNVLKGEMSLVGPRPERPCFVDKLQQLIPYYNERHSAKPGITGWAQVKYGYGDSVEDAEVKLQYDLYYIKHMSLLLDLVILIDTAKVILFGRGAR